MKIKDMSFLVVDDQDYMVKIVVTLLRSFGVSNYIKASDGEEALTILKHTSVNLILSDWNMPKMSGINLLKAVRGDANLAHLPFIIITSEIAREQIQEAINCGVTDILLKPYSPRKLSEKIEKALHPKTPFLIKINQQIPSALNELPKTKNQEHNVSNILAVDDMQENLDIIVNLFKDDYKIRVANNGENALKIIQSENQPDLVLLDINMPGIDGFTVFRKMRENPNSSHIPVIFVTSLTGEETMVKGLELGAIEYVTKPIDLDVLKLRVRNFMRYVELYKRLQDECDLLIEKSKLQEKIEHMVRHDLKAPLSGIIGIVQNLANDKLMDKNHVMELRQVEEIALQAINMINRSLELFKIENGHFQLQPEPVVIYHVLKRTAEISESAFQKKRLKINVNIKTNEVGKVFHITGDQMLCYSLFHNLIKNACEAAPDDSSIDITLFDENPVRISIQNKGVVPLAIRDCFFESYSTYGKTNGTGLGTYSAKLLTEAQHGSIEMKTSDLTNETIIEVTLPR